MVEGAAFQRETEYLSDQTHPPNHAGIYPDRIWSETGHWLKPRRELGACWKSHLLTYNTVALILEPPIPRNQGERPQTFKSLSSETCQSHPFSALQTLAEAIEERFQWQSGLPKPQEKGVDHHARQWHCNGLSWTNSNHMERVRQLALPAVPD